MRLLPGQIRHDGFPHRHVLAEKEAHTGVADVARDVGRWGRAVDAVEPLVAFN